MVFVTWPVPFYVLVAQLDRALASEAKGSWFDSSQAHLTQKVLPVNHTVVIVKNEMIDYYLSIFLAVESW